MESLNPLRFAVKLQILRRMKKWTMAQMALKIGVTTDRYEDLEAGQHEPRAGDIVKAINNLDLHFDDIDFTERGMTI